MSRLWMLFVILCTLGCEKRREEANVNPFGEDESEYVLMIVVDLSGSFQKLMAEDGTAYDFTLHAIDRYFRDRVGCNDQLILAQISGERRSLLWHGAPRRLYEEFPTARKFRDFLVARADPNGSMVHDGIAHAMEYLMSMRSVSTGKAKSATLILSDMMDNAPDSDQSEQRLIKAFTSYSNRSGAIGLYYCDQMELVKWRQNFEKAGLRLVALAPDVKGRPPLPSFE